MNRRSDWIFGAVIVAASVAAALAATRIFTPVERPPVTEAEPYTAPGDTAATNVSQTARFDRIEQELSSLRDKVGSVGSDSEQSPPQSRGYEKRIESLEAQLAELREAEEAKARNRAALQEAMNDPELRKKYYQYANRQRQRRWDHLGQIFQTQATDPEWAPEMMSQITNAFSAPGVRGAQLGSADCRQTMCRVDYSVSGSALSGDDPMALMELEHHLATGFAAGGDIRMNTSVEPKADGGYEYTMYVIRNDAKLPRTPSEFDGLTIVEAIERLRQQ